VRDTIYAMAGAEHAADWGASRFPAGPEVPADNGGEPEPEPDDDHPLVQMWKRGRQQTLRLDEGDRRS
jgi:hypothetical protein